MPIVIEEERAGYRFCFNEIRKPGGTGRRRCSRYDEPFEPAQVITRVTSWTVGELVGASGDHRIDDGIDHSTDPFVCFADPDDLVCPQCGAATMQATLEPARPDYQSISGQRQDKLLDMNDDEIRRLNSEAQTEAQADNAAALREMGQAMQAAVAELREQRLENQQLMQRLFNGNEPEAEKPAPASRRKS